MKSNSVLNQQTFEADLLEVELSENEQLEEITLPKSGRQPLTPILSPDGIEQIILENREVGMRLAWSLLGNWRIRIPEDEVISAVGAALVEAAYRFDPTRGVSFKTFFFYHLRGMLLKEISRVIEEQKVCQFVPSTAMSALGSQEQSMLSKWAIPLVEHNNPEKIFAQREIARLCWKACSLLDKLEQEVVIRSFVYDEPLVDIAKELGYCRCHVSRVKTAALAKLSKIIKRAMANDSEPVQDAPTEPRAPKRVGATKIRKARRKAYTGGRGRRKHMDDTSLTINQVLKKVVN